MYKKAKLVFLSAVVLFTVSAFSCDPAGVITETVTLYSEPAMDGRVTWEDSSPTMLYSADTNESSVSIGDLSNDIGSIQAFVSFDFSDIPAGAVIKSAILRLYQTSQSSGSSYGIDGLGSVLADNVSYPALSASDELFNASTTGSDIGIGPLSSAFLGDSWHEVSVIESAADELGKYHNGKLQFRLYHASGNNNDSEADTDGWAMAEESGRRPELIITYSE